MFIAESAGIIADDLTGANDTALQFFLKGCKTKILTANNENLQESDGTNVWAISTESRNISPEQAYQKVYNTTKFLTETLKVENLYKKIDSTLKGNIGIEINAVLDASDYEAAIIIPALPSEGRITIGGFHLLKGIPIERTDYARDPKNPIYESHIPTNLKNGLPEKDKNSVDLIDFNTVKQGAGPILVKLNDLVNKGKKLIVADSISTTDIEQIMLAVKKCNKRILACGTGIAAKSVCDVLFSELKYEKKNIEIPLLPKLVVSGSVTQLAAAQLKRLESDEDINNAYFINVSPEQILDGKKDEITEKALKYLVKQNTVVINSSELFKDSDSLTVLLFDKEISRDKFISMICDFLGEITKTIIEQREAVLITIGGETSYKCMKALNIRSLNIIDTVAPAIPLCTDEKSRYIVTKSGNLGNISTLTEVIRYFEKM